MAGIQGRFEVSEVHLPDGVMVLFIDKSFLPVIGEACLSYRSKAGKPVPALESVGHHCKAAHAVMEGDELENHPYLQKIHDEHPDGVVVFTPEEDDCDGQVAADIIESQTVVAEVGEVIDPDEPSEDEVEEILAGIRRDDLDACNVQLAVDR